MRCSSSGSQVYIQNKLSREEHGEGTGRVISATLSRSEVIHLFFQKMYFLLFIWIWGGGWNTYICSVFCLHTTFLNWRLRLEIISNAYSPHWSCLRITIGTFAWCFNGYLLLLWGISGGTSVNIQLWTIENLKCGKA